MNTQNLQASTQGAQKLPHQPNKGKAEQGGKSATLLTSVRGVGSQGRLLSQKLERWEGI